jgi:hypothetical protein
MARTTTLVRSPARLSSRRSLPPPSRRDRSWSKAPPPSRLQKMADGWYTTVWTARRSRRPGRARQTRRAACGAPAWTRSHQHGYSRSLPIAMARAAWELRRAPVHRYMDPDDVQIRSVWVMNLWRESKWAVRVLIGIYVSLNYLLISIIPLIVFKFGEGGVPKQKPPLYSVVSGLKIAL